MKVSQRGAGELPVFRERGRIVAELRTLIARELTLLALECDLALADAGPAGVQPGVRSRVSRLSAAVTALLDAVGTGSPAALETLGTLAAALRADHGEDRPGAGSGLAVRQQRPGPLSAREIEVLRLVATGASVSEVAKSACLAEGTVRNLSSSAMRKLRARNRFDAARIAMREGML
jgi:two-component system response regulator DesR